MEIKYVEKPHGFDVRMRVAQAVTEPLRDISVAAICRGAGISRQTFYSYFDSKYAIGRWYALHCCTLTLDLVGLSLTWREAYEGWFSLMGAQKMLFVNSAQQKYSDESARLVAEARVEAFAKTFAKRDIVFSEDYRYFAWMCAMVERSSFNRWLQAGCERPADEVARLTELCVPPLLYRALS